MARCLGAHPLRKGADRDRKLQTAPGQAGVVEGEDANAVDQILADEQVTTLSSAGDVYWPLTDNQGTVRQLAFYDAGSGDTTIQRYWEYDSFGNVTSETAAAVDHLFGYTGRAFDEATGLQNNLHRWYDPVTGRWASEDPIGFAAGDANSYRYVGNGPTNGVDPTGLEEPTGDPIAFLDGGTPLLTGLSSYDSAPKGPLNTDVLELLPLVEHAVDPSGLEPPARISVAFPSRDWFAQNDPKYQHRWFRRHFDDWHFGVSGGEEICEILGLDPDTVTASTQLVTVYGDYMPYLHVKGQDNAGNEREWYGMYEGVYNGRPLRGYSFYRDQQTLQYNLTGMNKLAALELLTQYYGLGSGASFVKLAGRPVSISRFRVGRCASATSCSNHLGAMGELLGGVSKAKTRITVDGRLRIPDMLTREILREVKNTQRLSYTRQLRDYCSFARNNGLEFQLYVRRSTYLTKPLRAAIDAGDINLFYLPGR
ncbi:MAG: hypothetical protein DWQ31_03500 [Planctomycetota bacterium]|nr:MAG: hypothetical protein DWQ31_03500 [Planctomycetota bacterium]